jgi:4-amino-4-deoxy-L-arabinose transferase-like glycosyltransferase
MTNRPSHIVNRQSFWVVIGLVGLAAAVRFPSLFANSFHADEALYGSYARLIGTGQDLWLQSTWVDKPPLLFYLQALFYPLLGTTAPFVARLPNFIASILLVPLVARLVWQLYATRGAVREPATALAEGDTLPPKMDEGEWAGWIAAAFVALSPYTIQFSSTAFLDPLMTFWLVAGLVAVSRWPLAAGKLSSQHSALSTQHSVLAGFFFGLAVVTKFQAGLFLPLVVGVGALNGWRGREWRRWFIGFMPVLLALVAWELARSGQLTLWQGQMFSYGGLRMSWSWELWSRLAQWGTLWQYTVGSQVLGFGLLLLLPLFLAFLIQEEDRATYTDQLFVLFTVAYFLFHWFVAIPAWDRYLLPLVPLIGLILGRFTGRIVGFFGPALTPILHAFTGLNPRQHTIRNSIFLFLLLGQLPIAAAAARSDYPIGGNENWDEGTAQVAEWLADEPYGTVLYDHWYGWHWRYYLFDKRVYHYWFPDEATLLANLRVFGEDAAAKYLILPPDLAVGEPVARALNHAGYTLELVGTTVLPDGQNGVSLYRIVTGGEAKGRGGEGVTR